jgi:hypothetical protein
MSRPMQHLCSTLPLLPIAARLSVPLGRTGRGFCWLLLLAMIVAPGFAQYSGVDGCIPGPAQTRPHAGTAAVVGLAI